METASQHRGTPTAPRTRRPYARDVAAIVALLIAILIGLLITRVATAALVSTGMSRQYARFQARSAFTGVGFTTSEAEQVVNHPVRRRVILVLMLLGNAGIATLIATLLLGFSQSRAGEAVQRGLVLAIGLAVIWMLAASSWVDRWLRRVLVRIFGNFAALRLRDYAGLLKVGADYDIGELHVRDEDWIAGRTLARAGLRDEGVIVLGIDRGGTYLGTPGGDTTIHGGDTLIVYGRDTVLLELDHRRRGIGGELSHVDRVAEHEARRRQERTVEKEPSTPAE
jgi:hypothetical protein